MTRHLSTRGAQRVTANHTGTAIDIGPVGATAKFGPQHTALWSLPPILRASNGVAPNLRTREPGLHALKFHPHEARFAASASPKVNRWPRWLGSQPPVGVGGERHPFGSFQIVRRNLGRHPVVGAKLNGIPCRLNAPRNLRLSCSTGSRGDSRNQRFGTIQLGPGRTHFGNASPGGTAGAPMVTRYVPSISKTKPPCVRTFLFIRRIDQQENLGIHFGFPRQSPASLLRSMREFPLPQPPPA